MIIRINKNYKKCFTITLINFLFSFLLFLSAQLDIKLISYILSILLCLIYTLYFLLIKEKDKLYNFIIVSFSMYFIFTLTYRKMIGVNSINYLLFLDYLCFIYLLKIFSNKVYLQKMIKDKYLILLSILIIISSMVGIIKGVSLWNTIMVIFVYVKLIPVYVVISYSNKFFNKEDVRWIIIINLIPLPILALKFTQDDFGGLFGYIGSTPFMFALIFLYCYFIGLYFFNSISIKKFMLVSAIYYSILVIGELKIALVLSPIITIFLYLISLIYSRKMKLKGNINFIIVLLIIPIIFFSSFNFLLIKYPEWNQIVDEGAIQFYKTYTQKPNNRIYEIGRMTVLSYTNDYIFDTTDDYIFGLGIGSAMPSQTAMFETGDYTMGWSNKYISLYESKFYRDFGFSLGYHNSGLGIWYIENGIIGMIIYIFMIAIFVRKSINLIKFGGRVHEKIIGLCGIGFLTYYCTLSLYYNVIFRFRIAFVFFVYMGVINFYERKIRY